MYGRLPVAASATASTQAPPSTTSAPPAAASWASRRRTVTGATARYTSASAGAGISPAHIFAMNARPSAAPAPTSGQVRPDLAADTVPQAATVMSRVSTMSGWLLRATATDTGVSAMASAAISPAARPNTSWTVRYSTATVATPASASGSNSAQVPKPNVRASSACAQNASGGLSTVMHEWVSSEPKKNAFQLCVALYTEAA